MERLKELRTAQKLTQQQMADYLGVDRSALSNELGKMRKEGIIEVNRNQIHYLERV